MHAEQLLKLYEPKPLGKPLEYERQLWQARFSPCGQFLIAGGYDATVLRWEAGGEELKPLAPLAGHNAWVQCLEFAPQGQRLFTADSWGRLTCWPYADEAPAPVWSLPAAHDGWIRALAVSPDGKLLASGGNDCVVRMWSAENGKFIRELKHPVKVFSLAFHPQGASLASGDLKGVIRDWDFEDETVRRELNAGVLYQLDKIQECGGARHLAFDSAGQRLACAGQKTPGGGFATGTPCVLVFDWPSGNIIREMAVGDTQDGFAYDARFHPAGFVMAVSCAFPGKGHLWFWEPGQPQAFYLSNKHPNGRSLSLHPDGLRLAMLISVAPNANGRPLKEGKYVGGSAKVQMFAVGE